MSYHNQQPYYPLQKQYHQAPPPPQQQQQHFVAELEAPQRTPSADPASRIPISHNGSPVFEMSADPAPSTSNAAKNTLVGAGGRRDTSRTDGSNEEPPTPANPWPYHGPGGDDSRESVLSPTVIEPSNRPGHSHEDQDSAVTSPISPSESMVPAPLSIKRPEQPSEQLPPKAYAPYHPPESTENSPGLAPPGAQTSMAYRPYRRQSYLDQEAEAQKKASANTTAALSGDIASSVPASLSVGSPPTSAHGPAPANGGLPYPDESTDGGGLPYPDGSAPHHFHIPSPPSPEPSHSPVIPHDTRPANLMPEPRPTSAANGAVSVGRPHSKSSPGMAPPPVAFLVPSATAPSLTDRPSGRPEEVVLWPPQAASSPRPVPGPSPVQVVPQASPPPPATSPHPQSAPTSTVPSPKPPSTQYAMTFGRPPPPQQPIQSPHQQPTSPSALGFVPQATYTSPTSPHAPSHSPRPPKSSSGPQSPQSPHPISPQSPPPPYSQAFPTGAGGPSLPPEKPSFFPRPPPPSSSVPPQQYSQYPTQPTYTATSTSQPTSAQPSPHGPPSPYHPQTSPYGASPTSPHHHSHYAQSPPPPHGQPTYAHPPQHQQHPPQPPHSASPVYHPPPPSQHYGGGSYNLAPPPLPPRPSSAHSFGAPPPVGFNAAPVAPVAYPPPPKTHYVPGPAGPKPPGAKPPGPSYGRPPTGGGNGKLFGSSVAKKWLDKTNQMVENKIEGMLQAHPDPRYRPQQQQGQPALPPHPHQQQQFAPQHYPTQPVPSPYNAPNGYQQQPQYAQGRGYGAPPPGR